MKLFSKDLSLKLLAMVLVLTISACASKNNSEDDPESSDAADTGSSVSTQGADDGSASASSNDKANNLTGSGSMSEMDMMNSLKQTEFKFAFDSSRVSSKDEKVLIAHGKFLAKTPLARVRLEGHADERGTREYNLALGERRAKSVKQILLSAGASSKQIEVITYGEEKPKAMGSNETAYAQNRRVNIVYTVGRP
jgi:peptidoglycan-associated lipoprotein